MKRVKKNIIITLTTVILVGGLIILGVYGFVRLISNQRNCEWANIDNIEIHAHIDIPKIKNYDCEYLEKENIKISCFDILTEKVDMDRYIQRNLLKKLESQEAVEFDDLLRNRSNINILKDSSDFYYRIGSDKGESWQIILNHTTGRLCVLIKYKD